MLPRIEIKALLQEAQRATDHLEELLAEAERYRAAQQNAFSTGNVDALSQLRRDTNKAEDHAFAARSELTVVLKQLSEAAATCAQEYQADLALSGAQPVTLELPAGIEGRRIEDCRAGVQALDIAVDALVSRIEAFRREQLAAEVSDLRKRTLEAEALGCDTATVRTLLEQETYLDLGVQAARERLGEELAVVRRTVESALRAREEQRQRERLEAARSMVVRIYERGRDVDLDEIAAAFDLLRREGSLDDASRAWEAFCAVLGSQTRFPTEDELALDHVIGALMPTLDDSSSKPWKDLVRLVGDGSGTGLDMWLANVPRVVDALSEAVFRDVDATECPSTLLRLKRILPVLARKIADRRLDHFSISATARWLTTPADVRESDEDVLRGLSYRLMAEGLWAEAAACIGVQREAEDRSQACEWIAVATDRRVLPASKDDWWEVLSLPPGFTRSTLAAATAAAASVWIGEAIDAPSVVDACLPLLEAQPALRRALEMVASIRTWIATHPGLDGAEDRLRQLREEVRNFLSTQKDPGGGPAREFYRQVLLPEIQSIDRRGGIHALAAIGDQFVDDLLGAHSTRVNPKAVHNMRSRVEDLQQLAERLVALEQALADWPDAERRREVSEALEREREAMGDDPVWNWAYQRIGDAIAGNGPDLGPRSVRLDHTQLLAALFADVPDVVVCPAILQEPAKLAAAVLERLGHPGHAHEWKVRQALEREAFGVARRFVDFAPPTERPGLEVLVQEARERGLARRTEEIELVAQMVPTLEPGEDLDQVSVEIEKAREALTQDDFRAADSAISDATELFEYVELTQRERRETVVRRAATGSATAVERLCRDGSTAPRGLACLVQMTAVAAEAARTLQLERVVGSLEAALKGKCVDWDDLRRILQWDERRDVLIEISCGGFASGAKAIQGPGKGVVEREPARFEELPKLVRLAIEDLLGSGTGEQVLPDSGGKRSLAGARSSSERFRAEWATGGSWEAPLVQWLDERGASSIAEKRFLPAAEYYLAEIAVGFRAACRLDLGMESARRAAFSFAAARLSHLRVGMGGRFSDAGPVWRGSPRDWIPLVREFLVHRGVSDLLEVLGAVMRVAPDLGPEVLDLPLYELPPLRMLLLRALLERIDASSADDTLLLRYVAGQGLSSGAVKELTGLLDRLTELANRPTTSDAEIESVQALVGDLGVDEPTGAALLEAVDRVRQGGGPKTGVPAEAVVKALTRELFVDTLEGGSTAPVHFSLSLKDGSPILRQVVVTVRCPADSDFEVPPGSQVVELSAVRPTDTIEIRSGVRLRAGHSSQAVTLPRKISVEIGDIALRKEGVLHSGAVPFKGRMHTLGLRPEYPFSERHCPYSPGPAVKDLTLIKGRSDEVKRILQTLRGAHQDNVPLVWGPRRIGKSTILYRFSLDPDVRRHYVPVFCDMENLVHRSDTLDRFLTRVTNHIDRALIGTPLGRKLPRSLSERRFYKNPIFWPGHLKKPIQYSGLVTER